MNKQDYAIVAGVNKYKHPEYENLKGSLNDARAFVRWLRSPKGGHLPKENIQVYLSNKSGTKPRRQQVEDAFDLLAQKAEATDEIAIGRRLYVYLAGHGAGGDNASDAALLLADHSTTRQNHVFGSEYADMFCQAGWFSEVLLFMDCCRDWDASVRSLFNMTYEPDHEAEYQQCYAFGCKFNRQSFERKFNNQFRGLFSWVLMRGLEGRAANDQGQITGESLESYVKEAMDELKATQEPKFSVDDDLVVADGFPVPTTPLTIKLPVGVTDFVIQDGGDNLKVIEPDRKKVGTRKWRVNLRSGRIYVVTAAGSDTSKQVKLMEVERDVAL